MFFYFLSFSLALGLNEIEIMPDKEYSYDIESVSFYFAVHASNSKYLLAKIIDKSGNKTLKNIEPWSMHHPIGSRIIFTTKNPVIIDIAELEKGLCGSNVVSASIHDFINIWLHATNTTENICLLFYQPGGAYQVTVSCESDNIDTICQLWSANGIATGNYVQCRANSSCGGSLSDGFVMRTMPFGEYANITTKIISIKGLISTSHCGYRLGIEEPVSGNSTLDGENLTAGYVCKPPSLQIGLSVALIAIMIFVILCGVLLYYMCRPNRDAYESSGDGEKEEKKNKWLQRRNSFIHKFDSTPLMPGK